MKYILLLSTLVLLSQCKQNDEKNTTIYPVQVTDNEKHNKDQRLETKKLLRELNNLENSIQGALALSQIALDRSTDGDIKALALTINTKSENVLTSISSLSATTNVVIGESRNGNVRSVEQAFTIMPVAELNTKYKDWVEKYVQRLGNSHKAISNKTALDKSDLLEQLSAYIDSVEQGI